MSDPRAHGPERSNRILLLKFSIISVAMFGFGYLMVPFYEQICKVTGLRNIDGPDEIKSTQVDSSRTLRLELDANVTKVPWQFRPERPIIEVHPGQLMNVAYEVENTTDRPTTGQAIPSYGPRLAGAYFKKLECFCFTSQSLGPHEKRRMPVVFVVDPNLPTEVTTITLSYTFFEVEGNGS